MKTLRYLIVIPFLGFVACSTVETTIQPILPENILPEDYVHLGLTADEAATLSSLTFIDDHPLYTMSYSAEYDDLAALPLTQLPLADSPWACSLFAAFADPENQLYGRNFDWDHSPAVLLFTDPPDGYASASMVDIFYLGYEGAKADDLDEAPLKDRINLLEAPYLPFDGFNEMGLVVGMAAVPPGNVPTDSTKPTVDTLGIIRIMLDHAATLDDAIDLMHTYNVDFVGTPVHYLIADASGQAALVEYYQGDIHVTRNHENWHQATNFLRVAAGVSAAGQCWRYDTISAQLADYAGQLSHQVAMDLLGEVAQDHTQWSVVYNYSRGDIHVAMSGEYRHIYHLQIEMHIP